MKLYLLVNENTRHAQVFAVRNMAFAVRAQLMSIEPRYQYTVWEIDAWRISR